MSQSTFPVTLLLKCCTNHLVERVVQVIEKFGFDGCFLAAAPNIATDNMSSAAVADKSDKSDATINVSNNIIYMKTTEKTAAAATLKSFVEHTLNSEHGTSMFCIEVKQRKYPALFPLLLMHDHAPGEQDLHDLFAPFGKCSIKNKDSKMTYINFKRFEQVEAVLAAMNNSQLRFHHMVLRDGLHAVQNTKLMLSFDKTFHDEHESILNQRCLTKEIIWSWFFEVKKRVHCEKTWEQLLVFLQDRIAMRFGMTYDAERELFCHDAYQPPFETYDHLVSDVADASTHDNHHITTDDTVGTDDDAPEPVGEVRPSCIADDTNAGPSLQDRNTKAGDSVCNDEVCDVGNHAIFHGEGPWGNAMNLYVGNSVYGAEGSEFAQDGSIMYEHHSAVVQRIYAIPLYGEVSHPLHLKLCGFEQQLFGRCEESNVDIHYRLVNMKMMMNINGENQPTSVRLVDLAYWI